MVMVATPPPSPRPLVPPPNPATPQPPTSTNMTRSQSAAAVLAILTLAAGRAYLRFREHAADVAAAATLGDTAAVEAELPGNAEQTWWNRVLGLHPTPAKRRTVVRSPRLLLGADRWSYLLLGTSGGLLTAAIEYFLRPLILHAGGTSGRVVIDAAVTTGVVFAVVAPPALADYFRAVRRAVGLLRPSGADVRRPCARPAIPQSRSADPGHSTRAVVLVAPRVRHRSQHNHHRRNGAASRQGRTDLTSNNGMWRNRGSVD